MDKFFFDQPTSAWNDAREFCRSLLQRDRSMSTKKAYRMYTKSLQTVRDNTAVGDEVREHAIKALATREAAFRSACFEVENGMQQHAATTRKHDLRRLARRHRRIWHSILISRRMRHWMVNSIPSALRKQHQLQQRTRILQEKYQSRWGLIVSLDLGIFQAMSQKRVSESSTIATSQRPS